MKQKTNKSFSIFYKVSLPLLFCVTVCAAPSVLGAALTEHTAVITASEAQLTTIKDKFGEDASDRIKAWVDLVANNKNSSEWHNIHRVNSFFNRTTFISDQMHWQKEDYWATPLEFLTTNGGDCEDFSIAKYLTLIALGIPVEKLQLMQVSTQPKKTEHMVVIYLESPTATPLVLDNLETKILPLPARHDLVPSYSFNSQGLWLQRPGGDSRKIKDSPGIRHWEDTLTRFNKGF